MKNKLFIIMVFFVYFLSGCSTSPLVRYPTFLEKKKDFKTITLVEEFLILDAMATETSLVNLPENQKWARICLDYFASTLQGKGYPITNSFVTSIGLLAEKNRQYKLISIPVEGKLSDVDIPRGYPPFYLNDAFKGDTLHEQLLQKVYLRLLGYEKEKEDSVSYVRTSRFLGKLLGADFIAFLFVGGFNVHASQQFGMLSQSVMRNYEKVSMENKTQITMLFYIVDAQTGEIIWDDHINMSGGIVYKEKLIKMATKILERTP